MIGVASVFLVLLQAATPARPGVVTGQLQTREGAPGCGHSHLRVARTSTQHPSLRRTELLLDDGACRNDAQRCAGPISTRESRTGAVLHRRQRLRISDVLSIRNECRPRHGDHRGCGQTK